ncbi:MAG TPA: FecR family protein [Planctomicrobium sp.]|nr:FecR family protein [Planctomicrobium sp.]
MNEFQQLVDKWLDGEATPAERDLLNTYLKRDPSQLQNFAEQVELNSLLRTRHDVNGKVVGALTQAAHRLGDLCPVTESTAWRRRSTLLLGACLGAILAVMLTVTGVWWVSDHANPGFVGEAVPPDANSDRLVHSGQEIAAVSELAPSVGRVSRTFNVLWPSETRRWSVEDQLHRQDVIELSAGKIELLFDSGAMVALTGPAVLEIHSAFLVSLRSGTATARVENPESGLFRVLTPRTEIVDLGTEFGVRVDPESQDAEVVVFDGSVNLVPISDADGTHAKSRRLLNGEAVRITKSGDFQRVVSVDSSAYSLSDGNFSEGLRRPLVISQVADDRRDSASPKFYRIFHGGLEEDARAFVDRYHEWNGISEEGMPYFLRGADYVATFNDDKHGSPVITVFLSQPATLYVFLDKRIPTPDWVLESFENTGLYIGLDEHFPEIETAPLGRGPGQSVDHHHLVWKRVVKSPGPVQLGTLNIPLELRGSMYGIAAQPLRQNIAIRKRGPASSNN